MFVENYLKYLFKFCCGQAILIDGMYVLILYNIFKPVVYYYWIYPHFDLNITSLNTSLTKFSTILVNSGGFTMVNNLSFEKAVDSFEKYLVAERGYSNLTVKHYKHDLSVFGKYLESNFDCNLKDLYVNEINQYQVSEFLSDIILTKDNSPAAKNRKLYCLRSFFDFLKKKQIIDNNPTDSIEASKLGIKSEPIYMQEGEIYKYLEAIKEHNSKQVTRDMAINKVFLYCGLRISELVNLDLEDINYDDQSIKFYGKGNKERYVTLHQ